MTVSGSGFNPTASQNTVHVNGIPAPVTSASSSQIAITIPDGATTGYITVANGNSMATSSSVFTVVTDVPVSISDFTPKVGDAGTVITILGTGFVPDPLANSVLIGTISVPVISSSETSLQVTAGTVSGKISVSVPFEPTAVSTDEFVSVPAPYSVTDVATSGHIQDGTPSPVAIAIPGKIGVRLFDGTAAQFVSLYVSSNTFAGATQITIYGPDGNVFASGSVSQGAANKLTLPPLTNTGAYMVVVQPPSTSKGELVLDLLKDASGTIVAGGAATTLSLAAGQNGIFVLSGSEGDYLGAAITSFAPAGAFVSFQLYAPYGGSPVWTKNVLVSAPKALELPQLPFSGTYALRVVLSGTQAAAVGMKVTQSTTGTLPLDGSITQFQTSGQLGRYTFTGTAGQGLTIQATAGSTFAGPVTVTVYQPDGSAWCPNWTFCISATLNANSDVKLDPLGLLPATGTYTVTVVPNGMDTGTVSLRLVPVATGALTVGDAATTLTLGTAQNGRYTFTGSAGAFLAIAVTALATSPSGGTVSFSFYAPNGSLFGGGSSFGAPSVPRSWALPQVPLSGPYTLVVTPSGTRGATLGVRLTQSSTGILAADGSVTQFQTTGQEGRYTFDGTAGQGWTMQATAGATFTGPVSVTIYKPDSNTLKSASLNANSDVKIDLGIVAASGTYTVVVVPNGVDTGTVNLRLVSEATDILTVGDAAKTVTLGTAQNGRYTFTGSAGDYLGVAVTSFATSPTGGTADFYLYKPDGSSLWTAFSVSSVPKAWQLPQLPSSGVYTLRVVPSGTPGFASSRSVI